MTKLSDAQAILLSTAAQRDDRSIYPLPDTLRPDGGLNKALLGLVKRGFAESRETNKTAIVFRSEGDLTFGLFATSAGLAAIGTEPDAASAPTGAPAVAVPPARTNKTEAVLTLLRRADGATLAELIAATSWLPHTTRAALTGLRKKGHTIERSKRGEETCYRVAA